MPKKRTTRIYRRGERFWADFRDFADVGGDRERLIAEGETFATADMDVATKLATERVQKLERRRKRSGLLDETEGATLAKFSSDHLIRKKEEGTSPRHLVMVEGQLRTASAHFGAERELSSITTREVAEWVRVLQRTPNGRGGTFSDATARKYLNALSDLFARAVSDERAPMNPARSLYKKPMPEKKRARYFEPAEVAALLEAARTLPVDAGRSGRGGGGRVAADAYPWVYPLLATAALTGLRKSELFGLDVDDVSFKYRCLHVRPNDWRELKTAGSERTVPLWPQLEKVLRAYLLEREQAGGLGSLLFPSHRHKEEQMLDNVDKLLDRIGTRAGIDRPRLHAFRHSYTAARIQTLEHGAPVHLWQVARELGHQSTHQIESRYGHLARVRSRTETVEFLPEPCDKEGESQPTLRA